MSQVKQSFLLPKPELVAERVGENLPKGLLIGAGGAGLIQLAAMLHEAKVKKEREAKREAPDALTVTIPSEKTASIGSWFTKLGPKMQGILMKIPGSTWAKNNPAKAIGIPATLGAVGGAIGVGNSINNIDNTPKGQNDYMWDAALTVLPALGGVALGAYGVNEIADAQHKKRKEKELEQAKAEYAAMLGQTLGGKTAGMEFPHIEGIVDAIAERLHGESLDKKADNLISNLTSTPALLGLLSLVVSHKIVHDKLQKADQAYAAQPVKPPKSIRIVTAPPAEEPAGNVVKTEEEELEVSKKAFVELSTLGAIAKDLADGPDDKIQTGNPVDSMKEIAPSIEKVDENTYRIMTAAGPVVVDATDPRAVELLNKKKEQLATIMASVPTLPAE